MRKSTSSTDSRKAPEKSHYGDSMHGIKRERDPALTRGLRGMVERGLGSRDYKSGTTSSNGKVAAGEKKSQSR